MTKRPALRTERLVLRPFEMDDAPVVQALAGEREIAATTLLIPHPYPDSAAEQWIGTHQAGFEEGRSAIFAITLAESGALIGAIGLTISAEHHRAELGYWIGRDHWGRGYATEAGRAVIDYAFRELDLQRVEAHHFANNPSSGRVLEKLGMQREGYMRRSVFKWGDFVDTIHYAILREG
jgi:ribosomal-protein-alanine N-acetyltransferase